MTCASCVARVEKALAKVEGVVSAQVNLATETVQVQFAGGIVAVSMLVAAVERAGYRATPVTEDGAAKSPQRSSAPWWPVAVAAVLSLLPVVPMVGMLFGRHWMLNGWLQLALATPGDAAGQVAGGTRQAPDNRGNPGTERLAARDSHGARDGKEQAMPISQVKVGDLVVIRPGERIPVDGLVLEGASQLDESLITGASLPVARYEGDPVTGGAVNGEGLLVVTTTAVGTESTLSRSDRRGRLDGSDSGEGLRALRCCAADAPCCNERAHHQYEERRRQYQHAQVDAERQRTHLRCPNGERCGGCKRAQQRHQRSDVHQMLARALKHQR